MAGDEGALALIYPATNGHWTFQWLLVGVECGTPDVIEGGKTFLMEWCAEHLRRTMEGPGASYPPLTPGDIDGWMKVDAERAAAHAKHRAWLDEHALFVYVPTAFSANELRGMLTRMVSGLNNGTTPDLRLRPFGEDLR